MRRITSTLILLLCIATIACAQLQERMIKVNVVPNHSDWTYKTGENATFNITVTKNRVPLNNVQVWYELSYDMMPAFRKDTLSLKGGTLTLNAGSMKTPGFLRCRVWTRQDGRPYEGRATAAFSPEAIQSTASLPEDFHAFWDDAKQANARIPMDTKLRLLPERCTARVNVYEWNVQNYRPGSRMYGILCVPTAPGKYPALLRVPGAGVRGYAGAIAEAEKGIITLEVGIHGIPVTLDRTVYTALGQGGLYKYQFQNWDNRDEVYYKRVYMGCLRAVDYLCSLPEFNRQNLVVQGGSQGGALAIVTAALDQRVTGVVSFYPALSDLGAYTHGRAGGWPHLFRDASGASEITRKKLETARYYDVVNFARAVKVPVFYYLGYNDMVCPPTTTYAVYNTINAPKELVVMPEAEHYAYLEHWTQALEWIYTKLKINNTHN